jgi:hypothetical protein
MIHLHRQGIENVFFLIPVAAGLPDDTEERREYFFNKILDRYEARIGETIRENIVFKRSFAYQRFCKRLSCVQRKRIWSRKYFEANRDPETVHQE